MASLRYFVGTINNTNAYCSLPNSFQILSNLTLTNDDLRKFFSEDKVTSDVTKPQRNNFLMSSSLLFSYFESFSRQLNLKIYSLNHVCDENTSDYSGCQNFIHALLLQDDEYIGLDEIETDVSVIIDQEIVEDSTKNNSRKFEIDDSDFSQVQDF